MGQSVFGKVRAILHIPWSSRSDICHFEEGCPPRPVKGTQKDARRGGDPIAPERETAAGPRGWNFREGRIGVLLRPWCRRACRR